MEMEQLYKEHSDRVYSYIYFLVRHRESAEDLTQETFYKAYKGLDTFNKQASTATWLLKIVVSDITTIFEGKGWYIFSPSKKNMI